MSANPQVLDPQVLPTKRSQPCMKILVYGLNFAPEQVGVGRYTGEMAEYLHRAGHDVRVVTAMPYYPEWQVNPAYPTWRYSSGVWHGIRVMRAPLWVPFRPGGSKRVLHLLSFAVTSLPLLMRQMLWRPDVVWMAAPALVCAPAALALAKLTGAKSWVHVQDFEVDIGFGMGLISGRWKRLAFGFERWILKRFDRVSTISKAMMERALAKGVDWASLKLLPNWADVKSIAPISGASPYRKELEIPEEAIVALYSGSMGPKQAVDIAAEAAALLAEMPKLYFVFCGEGEQKEKVVALCAHMPRVRVLPLQPSERLGLLLCLADIHLLPQRPATADMVMPSKLTGMLASGRPVVAMAHAGSELSDVVRLCGMVVPHGDVTAFAEAVRTLSEQRALREQLGKNARAFASRHLASDVVIGRLNDDMLALVRPGC